MLYRRCAGPLWLKCTPRFPPVVGTLRLRLPDSRGVWLVSGGTAELADVCAAPEVAIAPSSLLWNPVSFFDLDRDVWLDLALEGLVLLCFAISTQTPKDILVAQSSPLQLLRNVRCYILEFYVLAWHRCLALCSNLRTRHLVCHTEYHAYQLP